MAKNRAIMIQKKPGFTLMEVLMALGLLAFVSYTLSGQQIKSFLKVKKSREFFENICLAKKQLGIFCLHPFETTKPVKVELYNPDVTIITKRKPLYPKSILQGINSSLCLVESEVQWQYFGVKQSEKIMSFIYAPKPVRKKNREKK
jgi:prepilin-type N-terminal cleavage/methylation domain-containing protein